MDLLYTSSGSLTQIKRPLKVGGQDVGETRVTGEGTDFAPARPGQRDTNRDAAAINRLIAGTTNALHLPPYQKCHVDAKSRLITVR